MPKYTVKELAEKIGQTRQYVNVYLRREVIRKDAEGSIDTDHPQNKAWYAERRGNYLQKEGNSERVDPTSGEIVSTMEERQPKRAEKPTKRAEPAPEKPIAKRKKQTTDDGDHDEPEPRNFYDRKAKAELDLKLLNIKKVQIEIEQKEGKLLNMETAKGIVNAYMSSYSKSLFRDLETWLFQILDIHKIPLTEKTKHTDALERVMNSASERTMKELIEKLSTENAQL